MNNTNYLKRLREKNDQIQASHELRKLQKPDEGDLHSLRSSPPAHSQFTPSPGTEVKSCTNCHYFVKGGGCSHTSDDWHSSGPSPGVYCPSYQDWFEMVLS